MALYRAFDADTLSGLRKAVLAEAAAAGMPRDRATDVMLAVHELAANAVRHGAGAGRLAMRVRDGRLYCQVSDLGPASDNGQAARPDPAAAQAWPVQRGHGLWIVQAAADQMSVASGSAGSQVTAVFTLPRPPR
jgi:anti-sigma regulatory factor (Ser/Thr protein kinase)